MEVENLVPRENAEIIAEAVAVQPPRPQRSLPEEPGTAERPISILDEDDEKTLKEQKLEKARNDTLIHRACLNANPHDLVTAVLKTKIKGDLKRKEEVLREAIVKYFNTQLDIDITNDFMEQRMEGDFEKAKPAGVGVIVHGVDFLHTINVAEMMTPPTENPRTFIRKVIWANDSNCLVVFETAQATQKSLESTLYNPSEYKLKVEEEGTIELPTRWFRLKPYNIFEIKREVSVRYATLDEILMEKKEEKEKPLSRIASFDKAKQTMEFSMLK